jgi:competence protein ComEA
MRLILTAALLAFSAPAFADDFPALPAGPGRDVTVKVCAQCHSPEIVASQKMDQAGWKAIVDQMASNGAQATDAEFDTITKYLTASFPAGAAAPAAAAPATAAPTTPPAQ